MGTVAVLNQREWRQGGEAERKAFGEAFREGLEATGFVVLEHPGLPIEIIASAYTEARRFFEQPEAIKRLCGGSDGGQRGFTSFGVEHAKDQAVGDLKEFFHVGQEWDDAHARATTYPTNLWPADLDRFRSSLLALFVSLEDLAGELLQALALGYGLNESAFSSMLVEGNSILRVLHYPPLSGEPPEGALRAAPHEDINLITLLCEATDSGLEILTPSGWLPVQTGAGQIVVDAGDMLHQATGGVIPSTTHRVVLPEGDAALRSRYSMPFFAHPTPECDLSVLPKFASPERLRRFPPIDAGSFLAQRLREIGLLP